MIRFMGNGNRINNVLHALVTDCAMVLYHCRTGSVCKTFSTYKIQAAMLEWGFSDVFYLSVEPVKGGNE